MTLARFLLGAMAGSLAPSSVLVAVWLPGAWYWGCLAATLGACGFVASLCLLAAATGPQDAAAGPLERLLFSRHTRSRVTRL